MTTEPPASTTPAPAAAPAPTPAPDALAARNRLVIGLLLVSTFVVILNETIMGVALPSLMEGLFITAGARPWLYTVLMLFMAVVIPVTGVLF